MAKDDELCVEENEQQLQRLVNSETLRKSLTLLQLLSYLGRKSIEGKTEGLKEYTIGLEAFGRQSTFDPKTDTIVRVQIHRLRQKLKEYYEQEGIHDSVLVGIPTGRYYPRFSPKAVKLVQDHTLDREEAPDGSDPEAKEEAVAPSLSPVQSPLDFSQSLTQAKSRVSRYFTVPILAVLVLFALVAGYFAGRYLTPSALAGVALAGSTSRFTRKSGDPVKILWASFLGNDTSPIIAYPNAVFLLDDSNDLFRYRQGASDNRGLASIPTLHVSSPPIP